MTDVKVRDVMTSDVTTIGPDTPFKDIVGVLLDNEISGVPVVETDGRLVGIVSEGDLVPKEAESDIDVPRVLTVLRDMFTSGGRARHEKAEGLIASDVMSKNVVSVEPGERLHRAARRMIQKGVKRLPVVEDDRLVGIVTRRDVLRPFARTDEEIQRSVRRLLEECLFVPPDHEVRVTVRDGCAVLDGAVRFSADVRVAEALAASVDGVVDVHNALTPTTADPEPYPIRAPY